MFVEIYDVICQTGKMPQKTSFNVLVAAQKTVTRENFCTNATQTKIQEKVYVPIVE